MNAFITGSHAYGQPTKDSDVDLVVFVEDPSEAETLRIAASRVGGVCQPDKDYPPHSMSLRFGRLNLIVCLEKGMFKAWRDGTDQLIDETCQVFGSVSRERAVEVFEEKFREAGYE